MVLRPKDLWSLVLNHRWVDPQELRAAVEDRGVRRGLDYRGRLLIRDSLKALRHHWGDERVEVWLKGSPVGAEIETICRGPWDDERGFSSFLHYFDTFGELTAYLVDVYDVFLSKLFGIRTKDLDDLRALTPHSDKDTLTGRLHDTCGSMLVAESLRRRAADNWYTLYGETLPT